MVKPILVLAGFLALANPCAVNAQDHPFPFKVMSWPLPTGDGWGVDVLSVTITPLDDMVLNKITVNRGNCHLFVPRLVGSKFAYASFPMQVKFGLKILLWSEPNCEIRQMIFEQDTGQTFTLNFVDK